MTITYSQFKGGRRYTLKYEYTGGNQTWVQPLGVWYVESLILVAGGCGGSCGKYNTTTPDPGIGGAGGQVRLYRDFYVNADLTIYVGNKGIGGVSVSSGTFTWGAAAEDTTVTGGGLPQTLTAYAGYQNIAEGSGGSFGGYTGGNGGSGTNPPMMGYPAIGGEIGGDTYGGTTLDGHGGGGSYSKGGKGGEHGNGASKNAVAATGYGAGGGGGASNSTSTGYVAGNGGDGAPGLVLLTWWQ